MSEAAPAYPFFALGPGEPEALRTALRTALADGTAVLRRGCTARELVGFLAREMAEVGARFGALGLTGVPGASLFALCRHEPAAVEARLGEGPDGEVLPGRELDPAKAGEQRVRRLAAALLAEQVGLEQVLDDACSEVLAHFGPAGARSVVAAVWGALVLVALEAGVTPMVFAGGGEGR
jgi:hypothetical protein